MRFQRMLLVARLARPPRPPVVPLMARPQALPVLRMRLLLALLSEIQA